MTDKAQSLHSKLAQIMYEAERIPKNGTAPQVMGGYRFVQVGDAADYIRKALAEHSISMLPSAIEVLDKTEHETKAGGSMTTVDLRVTWTLTDGLTGETATIVSYGAGADGGDKYSGKATTSAMKYALLAGFLLSTGEDSELGDTSGKRGKGPQPAPMPEPKPEETLTSLGVHTREGAIGKGDGLHSRLEARATPDGYHIGWRLEVGDGKAIPQCYAEGAIGAALLAFYQDPQQLYGMKVSVRGEVFEVGFPGRKPYHRMRVDWIRTPDIELPAPSVAVVGSGAPVEADSVPLFSDEEVAEIAAREMEEANA